MSWEFESIEDQIVHLLVKKREFAIDVIHELDETLFKDKTCSTLVKIFKVFFNEFGGIPTLEQIKTIVSRKKFKNFDMLEAERIYDGMELTSSESEFVFDQIPKFIKINKFKALLVRGAYEASLEDSFDKQEEIFGQFESEFKEIMRFNIDRDLGIKLRADYKKRYAILKDRKESGVKPALKGLANYIKGYYPKELYAYVGMPSVGKSIMLACDAYAAMIQGFNVVLISMEMSEELFGLRMDQNALRKESAELLRKDTTEIFKMLEKRYTKEGNNLNWGEVYTKEFPTGEANVHMIERYLEMLKIYDDFEADLIVVDYGDIMRPNGRITGSRYDDQGKVFQELRAFAKEYNVPVLTAMQTNRPQRGPGGNVFSGPITEDRIADCFDKIRTLDGCFSINIDAGPVGDDEDNSINLTSSIITNDYYLYLIKNRNGKKEVRIPFTMNKMYMEVRDRGRNAEDEDNEED